MMAGPRVAKNYVSNYLSNDLPTRLQKYRSAWDLTKYDLPSPVRYLSYEPFALDKWPTLITLVVSTRSLTRDGYASDNDPNYRVIYEMRTYIWVRDAGAEIVTYQRDNLTTVVREALMDGPSLSAYDSSIPCYAKIDEGTIREEFSDLTLIKGERLLAGSYIAYDLALNEMIGVEPLGVLLKTEAEVHKMPIFPKAPDPEHIMGVVDDAEVELSWKPSRYNGGVYEVSGYAIQQSTDGGTTWTTVVNDTESTIPTFTVSGLNNGSTYRYRIAGINMSGRGFYSDASEAFIPRKPVSPYD